MNHQRIPTLFFCLIFYVSAVAGRDFMVLQHPAAAELYNQYEQKISSAEKAGLPVPMPLEIIAKKQLMGDQISSGMKLSFRSQTLYLLLDEKGAPAGLPPAAGAVFYSKCTVFDDTVTIAAEKVTLSTKPSGGTSVPVKKGVDVVRLFSTGQTTLIMTLSPPARFGWVRTTDRTFSKRARVTPSAAGAGFNDLHLRIMKHLFKINLQYDSVFTFLNTQTGRNLPVPAWRSAPSAGIYRYILDGTPQTISQLSSSTSYIVGEIERTLLGKPYQVSYAAGTITILPRTIK